MIVRPREFSAIIETNRRICSYTNGKVSVKVYFLHLFPPVLGIIPIGGKIIFRFSLIFHDNLKHT